MTKVFEDMTLKVDAQEAKAYAQVFAASISALSEVEAMKVANAECAVAGQPLIYGPEEFRAIPRRFGISPEQVAQAFKAVQDAKQEALTANQGGDENGNN